MAFAVKENESADPAHVGFLGTGAHVPGLNGRLHTIEEPGASGHGLRTVCRGKASHGRRAGRRIINLTVSRMGKRNQSSDLGGMALLRVVHANGRCQIRAVATVRAKDGGLNDPTVIVISITREDRRTRERHRARP
jgi:hypothetical protein